jgi:LPS-assembly lipoprotein
MLRRTFVTALLAAATLGACGFQLRGPRPMPFAKIYLQINQYSEFAANLKRQIHATGNTEVVDTPAEAEVVMFVLRDDREKIILSLNSAGTVREYQLRRNFSFRLADKAGKELMPYNQITVNRDISFNDSQVLAKEQEETLLYRDMDNDVVQQIIRRLAAAKIPAPSN